MKSLSMKVKYEVTFKVYVWKVTYLVFSSKILKILMKRWWIVKTVTLSNTMREKVDSREQTIEFLIHSLLLMAIRMSRR